MPGQTFRTMNDWKSAEISLFNRVVSPCPAKSIKLGDFLDFIRAGLWKLNIEKIRAQACSPEAKGDLKLLKKELLKAVTPSGTFTQRKNGGLAKPSGILCLDFDDLNEALPEAKSRISSDSHTAACFVSPSGNGLKVFVRIKGDHRASFEAAKIHYLGLGYKVDDSCKDVSRLCYVSYDPEIYVSSDSPELFLGNFSLPSSLLSKTISISTTTSTIQDGGIECRIRVRQELEKHPDFKDFMELYESIVAPRLMVQSHKRNEALTGIIPFLYNAVSKPVAGKMCEIMLRLNADAYTGSLEEQMTSLESLWTGCHSNYEAQLSPEEKAAYQLLNEVDQTAFRVFRDLARLGRGSFFFSYNEAQERLHTNGSRVLGRFCDYGILGVMTKGTQRLPGQRGKAGTYRWLPPLPLMESSAA